MPNHATTHMTTENRVDFYLISRAASRDRRHNFHRFFKGSYFLVEAIEGDAWKLKFPCLEDGKSNGTRGLAYSNVKTFKMALKSSAADYILVFEDDAEPPADFEKIIADVLNRLPDVKVVNFDKRNGYSDTEFPVCCTAAVLYHRSILPLLIREMDPRISNIMNDDYINKQQKPCLMDFLLYDILRVNKVRVATVGVVDSGRFRSTISF